MQELLQRADYWLDFLTGAHFAQLVQGRVSKSFRETLILEAEAQDEIQVLDGILYQLLDEGVVLHARSLECAQLIALADK